jgi:hypothetical protein
MDRAGNKKSNTKCTNGWCSDCKKKENLLVQCVITIKRYIARSDKEKCIKDLE